MSVSTLFNKNNFNINARTINGVSTQEITGINNDGDVLTIIDKNTKQVGFQPPPEGTPSAVGFPDGYVLKIIDNTTNTINWETDAIGGPVVPLVLTGDNANALKVQDTLLNTKLNIDTIADTVNINCNTTEITSSNIAVVTGQNQALLQTLSASVFINGADTSITSTNTEINNVGSLRITGTSAKGKVEVKTGGTNDTIFKIDTNGDVGNVAILGPNSASKFTVLNSSSDRILDVDTSVDKLTTAGKLLVEGNNEEDKFTVAYFGGASFVNADTTNSTFTLGSAGDITRIEPTVAKTTISGTTSAPTLLLNNFTTGSQLEFQALGNFITPQNKILSTNPLDMDISGKISINSSEYQVSSNTTSSITANNGANTLISSDGAQFTQLTLNGITGSLLLIEDIISPGKNHIEIAYNSIVSKGNPITNTANITFNPNTSSISQSDTNMDNISINNQPTLPEHGTRKDYVDGRVGNLFAGIADTLAVNSGSIVPTGLGTLTVPTDAFQIGDSFHLNMAGDCTFTGDTLTIELLADGSVIGTITLTTENTSTPPNPWELECDFTIRTLGVGGTLSTNFDFTYIGTNQDQFVGSRSVEVNTINTTIVNTLDVQVTFSGTDTIRTRSMYLKKVF